MSRAGWIAKVKKSHNFINWLRGTTVNLIYMENNMLAAATRTL
jgi:hypothetical protein